MAALAIEGIPYRRIDRAAEFSGAALLIAGSPADPEVGRLACRVPSVVVGPAPAPVAERFQVSACRVERMPVAVALDAPVWRGSPAVRLTRFGVDTLRLPAAATIVTEETPAGEPLATFPRDAATLPAVLRQDGIRWCLVDLGAAFADLLDEGYAPADGGARHPMARSALAAYYRAPEALRGMVQRRTYARLRRRLDRLGGLASLYPVDATGCLVLELTKAVLRDAAGRLVRLARWPAPYAAAATLTHDIEPSRYAYTEGLGRLLRRLERRAHPATFGLVAASTRQHLSDATAARLARHDVLCHGLEHRGETVAGTEAEVAAGVATARREVAERLGRTVDGFRSPRLDRSPALLKALDASGFRYDSSYPDVDRENLEGFGTGVRLNLPYRPPIQDGQGVRASRCLELPVSAPDCIQPLFQPGGRPGDLRRDVETKIAFIRATGGLYVGIVHAGVFGPRDTARRSAHLGVVRRRLGAADLWLTSAREVADWWCMRERLEVAVGDRGVTVTNRGPTEASGVRLVVEDAEGATRSCDVPSLGPGESVALAA